MIHKLFYGKFRKLHGWDLRNVQVACGDILRQAQPTNIQPTSLDADVRDVCATCDGIEAPKGQNVVLLEEAPDDSQSLH